MSLESDIVRITRIALGNTLSRLLIKKMLSPCPHGYNSRLEHALSYFSNSNPHKSAPSSTCLLDYYLISSIIRFSAMISHSDVSMLREALRDQAVRRGIAAIFRGIALYGISVPQKLPAPFLVVWNFTNMCNLKCKHCYQFAGNPLMNELDLHEKLKVLDQLDRAGVAALAFSGGEPTVHPDFLRIAGEASRRGLYVSVATNGMKFADKSFASKAKRAGVKYVEVSLDSVNPEVHDEFRGVKGSWNLAVRGLKNCIEEGMTTGIAMTLTKLNYREVHEMVKLAEELGVDRVVFFNFVPVGRGSEITFLDLSPEEREGVLKEVYYESRRCKIQVFSTAPQLARVALELSGGVDVVPTHFTPPSRGSSIRALAEFIGGCGAGRLYCAIQPDGEVTPCVFIPLKTGSLRERDFASIWNGSSLLRKLRSREFLEPYCGECSFKYVCGGCRARAYSYFNNLLAPDPGCIRNLPAYSKTLQSPS